MGHPAGIGIPGDMHGSTVTGGDGARTHAWPGSVGRPSSGRGEKSGDVARETAADVGSDLEEDGKKGEPGGAVTMIGRGVGNIGEGETDQLRVVEMACGAR